jgi:hypothetical protein
MGIGEMPTIPTLFAGKTIYPSRSRRFGLLANPLSLEVGFRSPSATTPRRGALAEWRLPVADWCPACLALRLGQMPLFGGAYGQALTADPRWLAHFKVAVQQPSPNL